MEEENNKNVNVGQKISIYSSTKDVYDYMRNFSSEEINEDKIEKIKDDEIDGEALIMLMKNDVMKKLNKIYGIKSQAKKKILKEIEINIFKENNNIKNDELYKEIFAKDFKTLCNSLKNKLDDLKFGQRLKYIKYLILQNNPNKENNVELKLYLDNIIQSKNKIEIILKNFYKLLKLEDNDFRVIFEEELELEENDSFILELIIEFIKEKEVNGNIKSEKKNENNSENIEAAPNYFEKNQITPLEDEYIDTKYLFYCVVEIFEYETSQGDIAYGMKNPVDEFKRICDDFHIDYKDECEYINYDKANEISISSNMIWGSKEGIYTFLENLRIKNDFQAYIQGNDNENRAGIYLCIATNKKIGYLIIWPGKFSYQYSKISETNNSMLLTLIRYGFYISTNSILCLANNEINNIDKNGYSIFKIIKQKAHVPTTTNIDYDINDEKYFFINEKRYLTEENKNINGKQINNSKINQNIILFFEELNYDITKEINNKDIFEFIRNESNFDLFFENNFEISNPEIFYLIINQNSFYKNNNDNKKCFSLRQLKDSYENKINTLTNDIFKQLNEELFIEKMYVLQ